MDQAPSLPKLADQARAAFQDRFGEAPRWIVAAPGRVNLIGEHTDYNDGFVLPMAIERYVVIAAARPPGGVDDGRDQVRVHSQLVGEEHTIRVGESTKETLPPWCVYPWGVLELMAERGLHAGPLSAVTLSSVPLGGGLSSSAALEVATATLVEAVTGQAMDGREKARLCQRAENEYVGMPCGIMDQFSSALCVEGEAMRLDCRSLETTPVPLADPGVTVLIINSNVKHELSSSEYPVRRAQCEEAAEALGKPALRDVTMAELERAKHELHPDVYRRARHVVSEDARTRGFADAAAAGDWVQAGAYMYGSHDSLRDDFEVSCPEVDTLVQLAANLGVEKGVYGSRITGGGFGGCTVTLVEADKVEAVADAILRDYMEVTGIEATAFTSRPSRGAHIIE